MGGGGGVAGGSGRGEGGAPLLLPLVVPHMKTRFIA